MTMLDPKFAKIVALMQSTQHDGEKAAARARAEAVAISCGMTFDEAMATCATAAHAKPANIFEGFDDWMEKREPGHRARCAAARAEKDRQRQIRRLVIIRRFGTEDAALAPCQREKLLRVTLRPWIVLQKRPQDRWTASVDGCTSAFIGDLSQRVREATVRAYPMPATFQEAKREHNYWNARRQEIEDVLGPNGYGDSGLDLVAEIRAEMVRALVFSEMPTSNLTDLHARFALYRDLENHDDRIEAALFRDLEEMVCVKTELFNLSTDATEGAHNLHAPYDLSASVQDRIEAVLRAQPAVSDRRVARDLGCSPTTVGSVRRKLSIDQPVRTVQRGGRTYAMRTQTQTKKQEISK